MFLPSYDVASKNLLIATEGQNNGGSTTHECFFFTCSCAVQPCGGTLTLTISCMCLAHYLNSVKWWRDTYSCASTEELDLGFAESARKYINIKSPDSAYLPPFQ